MIRETTKRTVVAWGLVVIFIWTVGMATSCLYTVHYIENSYIESAKLTARALIEDTILFRSWNARHGCVYAPVSRNTPPNPYLKVPERDIATPSGRQLTKVNPAYMTRQVFEIQKERLGIQGHITSLKPINPVNAPDQWERKALRLFEKGVKEYSEKVVFKGQPALRLMLPLKTERVCLKCHAKQGYKEGDIRGGISLYVPLAPYKALAKKETYRTIVVTLFEWLAGLVLILLGTSKVYGYTSKVERSERKFRVLFHNSPDPIFTFNGERITDFNQAMARLLGIEDERGLLTHPANLSPENQPDGQPSFKRFNARATDALVRGETRFKWLFKRSDGELVWVEAVASRVARHHGKGHQILVSCRDITRETELQERMLQVNKLSAIGELASGIAHDFNNILAVVVGSITLARDMGVSVKADEMLEKAEAAVMRAATLARKLIMLSPGGTPVLSDINLEELLTSCVREVMERTDREKVKFAIEVSPGLKGVKGDYHQLIHACTAVLDNALEALEGKGTITIKAENIEVSGGEEGATTLTPGSYVKVSISDSGKGIPPAILPKVFDPFFTTKELGRGLGLSIAYSVVKRHGGEIEVESKPEEGTTITIYLPAGEETERVCMGARGKILVLEDDPYQRELFTTLLTNLGYCVVGCSFGEEAVREFQKAKGKNSPFDLVILDLLIPDGMDGRETCKAILEIDPKAKVVITSVATSDEAVTNFKDYGFVGALPKPFTMQELARVVENALKG